MATPSMDTPWSRLSRGELPPGTRLYFAHGTDLVVEALLRTLPDKRVVLRGQWQGQTVIAKCYLDRRRRHIHARREAAGLARLQAAGIATSDLLASLRCGEIPVLVLGYIPDAHSLRAVWRQLDPTERSRYRERLVDTLAVLHDAGYRHGDLHLDNWLVSGDALYLLDGDAVKSADAEARLDNLAFLLAELDADDIADEARLLERYATARQLSLDPGQLKRRIARERYQRLQTYGLKLQRSSTRIVTGRGFSHFWARRRELTDAEWIQFCTAPQAKFDDNDAVWLKRGNSASVIHTHIGGQSVVIKRYNIKSLGHGLRVGLRRISRARQAWIAGFQLELLGIATPRPLALVERRFGPWKREAYLVTEAVAGEELLSRLTQLDAAGAHDQAESLLQASLRVLRRFWAAGFGHGDLKASNLLAGQNGPVLIDLDSARLCETLAAAQAARAADCERFLRNWQEQPELYRQARAGLAESAP